MIRGKNREKLIRAQLRHSCLNWAPTVPQLNCLLSVQRLCPHFASTVPHPCPNWLCHGCASTVPKLRFLCSVQRLCPNFASTVPQLCSNRFCLGCASTVPNCDPGNFMPRLGPNCAPTVFQLCPNCAKLDYQVVVICYIASVFHHCFLRLNSEWWLKRYSEHIVTLFFIVHTKKINE